MSIILIKDLFEELNSKVKIRLKIVVLFAVVTTFLESFSIISIFPIMKALFDPNFFSDNLNFIDISLNSNNSFYVIIIIVFIVFFVKNISIYYSTKLQSKFINFAILDFTSKYFKSYLELDYKEFIKFNSSYYVRNVIENITVLFNVYLKSIITIFIEILLLIILLVVLLSLNFKNTLFFIIFFTIICSIIYYFYKSKLTIFGKNINDYNARKLINLNQAFNSYKEINLTNSKDYFSRIFSANLRDIAQLTFEVDAIQVMPRLVLETTCVFIVVIFLYLNFDLSYSGNYDYFAELALFALVGLRMLPSASKILSCINRLKFSQPVVLVLTKELLRFKKNENLSKYNESDDIKIHFNDKIEFKNVFYSYDNNNPIFNNLNIKFKKSKINIILGNSGFGKTTLINLLLGFFRPDSGKILSDQNDINLNLNSWRDNLAFVPQEIYFADEKLISNIAFGENEQTIDKKKIYEVLKVVDMKEHVLKMPNQLNTRLGDKSFKLSGGQRQRIAIARCLYKEKKVMIFDEATSSLDKTTEEKIMKNIKKNYSDKTIIFVTHRNSLVKFADEVFRFNKKGEIKLVNNKIKK